MKNMFVPTVVILAALWCSCSLSPAQAQQKPAEPKLGGAQVTVPWDEFKDIFERLRDAGEAPAPPVDFSIARSAHVGRIEGGSAKFDVTMQATILKPKGWTLVPIASAKLAIDSITVDGKPANVVTRDGWHSLVFNAAGAHEIKFTVATSVATSANIQSVNFALPTSTQTSLDLTLPQEDLSVELENAVDVSSRVEGKTTRITGRLPAQAQLSARWQKALPAVEKREARVSAKVFSLVAVLSDALRVDAKVQFSVLHVAVQKFELDVPEDVTVEKIVGQGVHTWNVNRQGRVNRVTVFLKDGVSNDYGLTLTLLKPLTADKPVIIPIVEPQGLNAPASGEVGVETAVSAEIKADDAKGASKIDTREAAESLLASARRPLGFAYSYTRAPQIQLSVTRHRQVPVLTAMIDLGVYSSTYTLNGQVVTRALYFVRNNESQYLRIKLPEGARVWSAIVNGQGVKPVTDAEGLLLVPIVKSRYLTEDEIEERKEKKREDSRGHRQQRERVMRQRSYQQLQDEMEQRELKAYPVEVVYAEALKQPFQSGGWKVVAARLPQVQQIPIAQLAWAIYLPQELRLDETRGTMRAVSAFSMYGQDEELLEALEAHRGELHQQAQDLAKQMRELAQQKLEQAADNKAVEARERGLLPVKVEVPRVGQLRRFEKLLVSPTDELKIEFDYKLPSEAGKQ